MRTERIEVPEMGDHCFLRVMSARVRDAYEESVFDGETRNTDNLGARLVVRCLCDESGELLFGDAKEGEEVLGNMPTTVIERL